MRNRPFFYLLFSIGFLFASHAAVAQRNAPAKMKWSKEYRTPNNTYLSDIVYYDADKFIALRQGIPNLLSNKESISLELFTHDMRLKKSNEIDLRYKKKKRSFERIIVLEGQMYLLTSFNNQAHNKNYLFRQEINMKTLVPSNKVEKIGEIDTRRNIRKGNFDFHISEDSTKLLVYNQLPFKRGEPERFAYRVYNQNFELLWKKNVTLPYRDDRFRVQEYRVDNDGNVYLLGVAFEDVKLFDRRNTPNYSYSILAYTNDGADKKEYRVDLGDKFITDLTFRIAKNGDLICSGFYSDRGTISIKGTYFFKIDSKTEELYNKNVKKFDFDFLTEDMREGQKQRAAAAERNGKENRQAELYRYVLDDLVLRSDGGAVLLAEQYWVQERRTSGINGQMDVEYIYNYNDIIVVNINPDGTIAWSARIPKRQRTRNDGGPFSSYASYVGRDGLYFVYNDNPKNFNDTRKNPRSEYAFNGKKSVIALAKVDVKGDVETFMLESNKDLEIISVPKASKQIGKKLMAVYGQRKRSFKFGMLEFK